MIDSHVHLNRAEFNADRGAVLERAAAAGITRLLNVGYDLGSSEASIELAESDARIFATAGVHPHDATQIADAEGRITEAGRDVLAALSEMLAHPRVVAVGEIGLDFYRDLSPRPAQHAALLAQLELAAAAELPVIFHIRNAYAETIAAVTEAGIPARGAVLHAFAGDERAVRWARRHGLLLGIGGPVTYKNNRLATVLADATCDDVLLETDAPWLPPVPHRGRRNEPAFMIQTRDRLAEILGVSAADLVASTDTNFSRLFLDRNDHCNSASGQAAP